ncbi:S8 family serine peptidase [Thermomonospora umbrina]|uniref:Subtilase family protein n=1 Tax=Thermomonospora umbrina TaxID=111806 RepID=A0A3D9SS02_9ACTN|nr:S8 family serine peptidase [Thermomonospora umbrina]REE97250.1 subtilase family protein [Thermomonospora umbrina]
METAQALALTGLDRVMARVGQGAPAITVGLLDGPVAAGHGGFAEGALRAMPGHTLATDVTGSPAQRHGTMVAGVLAARRGGAAPGLCPGCPVLVRPVFDDGQAITDARRLADGIVELVAAGARIINISAAFPVPGLLADTVLTPALDHAAVHGVLVVAAAGNDSRIGGSPLVSHPWVLPVAACDAAGGPLPGGTVGTSIGRRGVTAPGGGLTTLAPGGGLAVLAGTSAAAVLATGAIALAWSAAPDVPAVRVRHALLGSRSRRQLIPPLLDAWRIHQTITGSDEEVAV